MDTPRKSKEATAVAQTLCNKGLGRQMKGRTRKIPSNKL